MITKKVHRIKIFDMPRVIQGRRNVRRSPRTMNACKHGKTGGRLLVRSRYGRLSDLSFQSMYVEN